MKSTGDFHALTAVTGDESCASLFISAGTFFPSQLSVGQSCTPWRSTPAANKSELRPKPSAVKTHRLVGRKLWRGVFGGLPWGGMLLFLGGGWVSWGGEYGAATSR